MKKTTQFVKDHVIENGFLKYTLDRSGSFPTFASMDPANFGKYFIEQANLIFGKSKFQHALAKAYDTLYDALEGQDFRTMNKIVIRNDVYYDWK